MKEMKFKKTGKCSMKCLRRLLYSNLLIALQSSMPVEKYGSNYNFHVQISYFGWTISNFHQLELQTCNLPNVTKCYSTRGICKHCCFSNLYSAISQWVNWLWVGHNLVIHLYYKIISVILLYHGNEITMNKKNKTSTQVYITGSFLSTFLAHSTSFSPHSSILNGGMCIKHFTLW